MFKLKRLNEPLGTADAPQYETSYSEGLITVINGECEVRLPETRDRLVMLGYEDIGVEERELAPSLNGSNHAELVPRAPKPKPKKKRGR